ncbi:mandelate racemase/muconate lactonizing enzyme family protein [Bradyrhizobium sp. CCBAU 53421]|uniref:mandelate racemase/muconate lactonizing enzyme family protein n=1 Tax=Bradyrhizobium sp. CCBAU 53421 TaxID=1325120 RepID=UPI00188B7F50|nr:mandelate racemase/muconate lactonizing enzyme family protein [Bradyrhizobium sp. CCBAU 53421]QOZ33159.1 mandelate racemase/muconate lactonizing enzyme family protein [Bradyrhizobium sp. CCBAU 53421]
MRITEIEVQILTAPNEGPAYWVSNFTVPRANELLVRIRTASGIEGFGLATSFSSVEPIVQAFKSGIGELIVGEDAASPERLYERLFSLTSQRVAHEKGWGRETLIRILSAVDIACWDAIGKAARLPLYKLFGGYRDTVPCYVTCAYYRDGKTISEIRDEALALKSKGHRAFKAKFGGLPLKDDMKRMEALREVIGDLDLMIDINRAWSLKEAIDGARALEPLNICWLEEPVRWADDHRQLRLLARETKIPLSAGESELSVFRCRDLIEDHSIQIMQADSTMSGGYTALKKLSALCELYHVDFAPHHDCYLHAPLVASSPAGLILESFDADRDPLQAELFENPPEMTDGMLRLNEAPGIGVTLSEKALRKYGRRII